MTTTAIQPEAMGLSDRLRQRLRTLGVTVLRLAQNGQTTPSGEARAIERLIVQSPQFRVALQRLWPQLIQKTDQVVDVWPGVRLVPLPAQRRRRVPTHNQQELIAALLLGPDLLHADQLRAVCDAGRVDYRSTVAQIDAKYLIAPSEAQRLAATVAWLHEDANEMDRRMIELQALSGELAESYEELSLLYKLSSNMTVNQQARQFLADACHEMQQVVGLRWMALHLQDEPRLENLAGATLCAGLPQRDPQVLERIGRDLLARLTPESTPVIIDDTAGCEIAEVQDVAHNMLIVPLHCDNRPLGVLFGANKLDDSHISSIDTKLCDSLANSLSIFLENRMLYDDMQAMFLGTLHALTSAIDAKDSYTHGHSERVALMSRQLAEAAGLDQHTVERIYIAGLVHDVGKIGVPEAVLCKPGRLTKEEFDLIKMHPEIGGRILQDIRQMQDLIPGVMHHHERWDGRGYPHNLKGIEIPLFGRVIGLADSFDAMSSNRTYRDAMPLDEVLAEIERCAGAQFDPALAKVFLKLDFEPYFRMIDVHHARQLRKSA